MRHLGLITAEECKSRWDDFNNVLNRIKEAVEFNLDISALLEIADSAPALNLPEPRLFQHHAHTRSRVTIGVAFDEAFNFYYHDTLDLLRHEGAEIVYFSPIRASRLPEGLDALYIGGGFPRSMLASWLRISRCDELSGLSTMLMALCMLNVVD